MSSLRWPCPDLLTMSPCSFFVSLQCMLVVVRPPGMKCSWCFGMLIYCDDGQIRPFGTLWLISRFLSPLRIAGLRKYCQIRIHREQPISALCDIKTDPIMMVCRTVGSHGKEGDLSCRWTDTHKRKNPGRRAKETASPGIQRWLRNTGWRKWKAEVYCGTARSQIWVALHGRPAEHSVKQASLSW